MNLFIGDIRYPRSVSSWLYASSFFFAPLSSLTVALHISVCDSLLVAATMTALVERMARKEPIYIVPICILIWIALSLSFLVSMFTDGTQYWTTYAVIVAAYVVTPQAISLMRVNDLTEMKFMLGAWMLGGLVGATFILAYCNGLIPWHADWYWLRTSRASGLTHHPNLAGLGCFLTFALLLMFFSYARTASGKIGLFLLMLLTLKALDYTSTRSSFIAMFVVLCAWIGLHLLTRVRTNGFDQRSVQRGVVIGFCIITVSFIYAVFGDIYILANVWNRFFVGDMAARQSVVIRESLNTMAWSDFLDSPFFGNGFRWIAFSGRGVAHNMYLQYLQAAGLMGFSALMMFLLYPMFYSARVAAQRQPDEVRYMNHALLAAAVGVMIWLWAQSGFSDYQGTLLFSLLLYLRVWRTYAYGHGRQTVAAPSG